MPTLVTRGAASVRGFGFAGTTPVLPDPYFNYTTLLLHGNGTNGGQNNTFLDSGTANSGSGFNITRNGNTTQGTFSPFSVGAGYWSNYFDGSGDYLTLPSSSNLAMGTGDFCIEMFVFPGSSSTQNLFTNANSSTGGDTGLGIFIRNTTQVRLASWNTAFLDTGSNAIFTNQWNHVAVCRSGTTASIFVNGTRQATGTVSNNFSSTNAFYVGTAVSGGDQLTGYISNLRAVKGSAVYDPSQTSITVPTAPLTAITNTQLLTCQDNRFRDASGNTFTITVNGNTSVQAFSPFAPTAAYSASTVGGSGYFDGTGDYLNTTSSANLNLGASNFTVEFWVNPSALTNEARMVTVEVTSSTTVGIIMGGGGAGGSNTDIQVNQFGTGTRISAASVLSVGAWFHVAVTYDGTTSTLWVNGISKGTYSGNVYPNSNSYVTIGGSINYSNATFNGYLSNVRVLKGTCLYTTTFTPPTAPLTNITNTSLLLNFTNAAIIDNTAKNVLETVGNAQISTTQSKFGGGSILCSTSSDYLRPPNSLSAAMSTGDFTIEFWFYASSLTTFYQPIIDTRNTGASATGFFIGLDASGKPDFYTNGADRCLNASAISTGQWYHIAVCRASGSTRLFINGVQGGSTYTDANNYSNQQLRIGTNFDASLAMSGYIDDLRITKGIARYTSNFTPQTSQWQDQ